MKFKHFMKRVFCFLLAGFILLTVFCSLTQSVHANFYISDYDKYLEIIEQLDLPTYYVLYEHIQVLGDYKGYTGPQYRQYDDSWNLYEYFAQYSVTDKNNQMLIFSMTQKSLMPRPENHLRMPLFKADMQTVNTDEQGIIVRGPLRYRYNNGHLNGISWSLGDVNFNIQITQAYPMDAEETIFSRLLSGNYFVALAAYYDLIRDIPLQPGETWLGRIQHILWPPVILILLIAACITAIWLICHIRRRKRAMFPTQWHNRRWD